MSVFLYEPFYDFDRFFDEAFGARPVRDPRRVSAPDANSDIGAIRNFKPRYSFLSCRLSRVTHTEHRMDLHENAENNQVTATFELPGLKKEDVEIDVHNGRLTISAENKISSEHEDKGYAIRERRYGKFSRTLQLPQGVKVSRIVASI